jgi:hypothetical protein
MKNAQILCVFLYYDISAYTPEYFLRLINAIDITLPDLLVDSLIVKYLDRQPVAKQFIEIPKP